MHRTADGTQYLVVLVHLDLSRLLNSPCGYDPENCNHPLGSSMHASMLILFGVNVRKSASKSVSRQTIIIELVAQKRSAFHLFLFPLQI